MAGLACAGLALLALGGCQNRDGFLPGCPNVGIVRDAATWRQDGGTLVMSAIDAQCGYEDTGVTVQSILTITGRPAEGSAGGGAVPVEYFVAVADPQRNIIAKQVFAANVPLGAALEESLVQFIPAPKTVDARWYEVLVGFQLPPEQVEMNQRANEAR